MELIAIVRFAKSLLNIAPLLHRFFLRSATDFLLFGGIPAKRPETQPDERERVYDRREWMILSIGGIAGGILTILGCAPGQVRNRDGLPANRTSSRSLDVSSPPDKAAMERIAAMKMRTGEFTEELLAFVEPGVYSTNVMLSAAYALALRQDERVFPALLKAYASETLKLERGAGYILRQPAMRMLGIIRMHYRVYPQARKAIQEFFWLASFGGTRRENIWERWQVAYGMKFIGLEALQRIKIGLRIVRRMSSNGSEWIFRRFYEIIIGDSDPEYPRVPHLAGEGADDFKARKKDPNYRPPRDNWSVPGDDKEKRDEWKGLFSQAAGMSDQQLAEFSDEHAGDLADAIRYLQEPDDISRWDKFLNISNRLKEKARLLVVYALLILRNASLGSLKTGLDDGTWMRGQRLSKVHSPDGVILPQAYRNINFYSLIMEVVQAPADTSPMDEQQARNVCLRILKLTRKEDLKIVIISVLGSTPQLEPEVAELLQSYILNGSKKLAIAAAQAFRWKKNIPVLAFKERLSWEATQAVKKQFAETLSTSSDSQALVLLMQLLVEKENEKEDQKRLLDLARMWYVGLGNNREEMFRDYTRELPPVVQNKFVKLLSDIEAVNWVTTPGYSVWMWMGRAVSSDDDPDVQDPDLKDFIKYLNAEREYLFRSLDRRGYGKSLGPRSSATESLYGTWRSKPALASRYS